MIPHWWDVQCYSSRCSAKRRNEKRNKEMKRKMMIYLSSPPAVIGGNDRWVIVHHQDRQWWEALHQTRKNEVSRVTKTLMASRDKRAPGGCRLTSQSEPVQGLWFRWCPRPPPLRCTDPLQHNAQPELTLNSSSNQAAASDLLATRWLLVGSS